MCLRAENSSSEMPLATHDEMLSHPGLLLSFRLANVFTNS